MKFTYVFIPSARSGDIIVDSGRKEALNELLLHLQDDNLKIIICSQNYNENDYIILPNVKYVDAEIHGVGAARNILLDIWNSVIDNEPFCFFLDDDLMFRRELLKKIDAIYFIKQINKLALNIDVLRLSSSMSIKKELILDNKTALKIKWDDTRTGPITAAYAMRQLDKSIRFNEAYLRNEDTDFCCQIINKKYNVAIVNEPIICVNPITDSFITAYHNLKNEKRIDIATFALTEIATKYLGNKLSPKELEEIIPLNIVPLILKKRIYNKEDRLKVKFEIPFNKNEKCYRKLF